MKIGSKRDVNRDHKRLTQQDVPKKIVIPAAQHDPPHDLKRLAKQVRSADGGTSVFNECRDCHNEWRD